MEWTSRITQRDNEALRAPEKLTIAFAHCSTHQQSNQRRESVMEDAVFRGPTINTDTNDLRPTVLAKDHASTDDQRDGIAQRRAILDQVFARVPEAIVLLDTEDRILEVNPEFTKLFGYAPEEARGRRINELVVPEESLAEPKLYPLRELPGAGLNIEGVRTHKDGTRVHVSIIRGNVLSAENQISEYVIYRDITDRKVAEQRLRESEAFLAEGQRLSVTGSLSWSVETDEITWSEQLYRIFEFDEGSPVTLERIGSRVHPDDLPLLQDMLERARHAASDFEYEHRLLMPDKTVKHIHLFAHATRGKDGRLEYVGAAQDVTRQKVAEEQLRQRELNLRLITQTIPGMLWSASPDGEVDYCNAPWLDFAAMTMEQAKGWGWVDAIYPDDRKKLVEHWRSCLVSGTPFDLEARMRRFDGSYRWFLFRTNPLRDESNKIIKWYGTSFDIEDQKRAEEMLRAREMSCRQIIDNIPGFVHTTTATGEVEFISRQTLDYFGKTNEELRDWSRVDTTHPDDLPRAIDALRKAIETGQNYEIEQRCRRADGMYRWFQARGHAVRDAKEEITAWYWLLTDIEDRKRAEEKVRQSEQDLRMITDTIRQPIVVLAPDGSMLYANRVAVENSGLTIDEMNSREFLARACHPDDVDRLRDREEGLLRGDPFELELRTRHKSGEYRWYLIQYNPLKDDLGQVIRWYATATDINDQKETEERLRNENLVLREEIDRSSMFEEMVGSSKPMRQALKQVEKVAPLDSTVLILGETGTGKELIARALHRRSKRVNRPFVRVNCAAIPQSLIASELFGHEKGAFTGALQRRVGRFEAAHGGTLFLDEIGELPMETQIALLRVLQEKEFERVGSNHPISVDVRVIAATNRDLPAAVAAGTFRQDLFFRLDVFPIAVPSLQERVDDIPLLVEYFVGRFAKEAGKTIRHIGRDTLKQLQDYHWPGNIRELQNVVERAVILSESDIFVVEDRWLKSETAESCEKRGLSALEDREAEMIAAVLAETHGRISGPSGAAAKLGIPRQTLESKIRRIGIDKYGHKRPTA